MDLADVKQKFDEVKRNHDIAFDAKDEQLQTAAALIRGKNVLGFLPTGYGKTLCIVIQTMINKKDSITLIVSPLSSLIDDQMATLGKWQLTCAKIESLADMSESTKIGIAKGDFQFVFSSPESVLKPYWRKIFLSSTWQSKLHLIAVDEAHCVSEWGEEFRKDFQQLGELRSFFKVPVLALTATSTEKVKVDIMKYLQLTDDNTEIIFRSSDRPNIFISLLQKQSQDYEVCLDWLIQHIKENGKESKKTIIYCRSIDTVSDIFLTFKSCLGPNAFSEGLVDADHLLIEMFHKSTHQDSKTRIISEFKRENSTIRCVIATVALGMGLDIKDIDLIVHIGCPKSILSYWQEAGRCARDGRQGYSLILYDNFTLSLKSTAKDIADVIKNKNQCLRQQILDLLTVGERVVLHPVSCSGCDFDPCRCLACRCCSVCSSQCYCHERQFDVGKFLLHSSQLTK